MGTTHWLARLGERLARLVRGKSEFPPCNQDKGLLAFANTSEVIAAERALMTAGFEVEVQGPPPDLQTGCDMVIIFPLLRQAAVESALAAAGLRPVAILPQTQLLLAPVSLYQIKDLGDWLMARAANMKITIDKRTGIIVNISGGGCPDVPWLAAQLTGQKLAEAPAPLSLGHTLCCYSLQKAFEELKRICPCG